MTLTVKTQYRIFPSQWQAREYATIGRREAFGGSLRVRWQGPVLHILLTKVAVIPAEKESAK